MNVQMHYLCYVSLYRHFCYFGLLYSEKKDLLKVQGHDLNNSKYDMIHIIWLYEQTNMSKK